MTKVQLNITKSYESCIYHLGGIKRQASINTHDVPNSPPPPPQKKSKEQVSTTMEIPQSHAADQPTAS